MLSAPKLPSIEVEAKEDAVEEEEIEGLQLQKTDIRGNLRSKMGLLRKMIK